jgi:dUTP pyrophosphatase
VIFLKIRDVKRPQRKAGDAGIDFFVPEKNDKFIEDLKEANKEKELKLENDQIILEPNKDVLIPSGIKSKFGNNLALIAFNKSGVAVKKNLICGACVIDSSYQGEIHLHMINVGNETQVVNFGEKILQFIPIKIENEPINVKEDVPEDEFYTTKTDRGAGGFGSTGVN